MITVSSEHHVYGITPSELYGLSTDVKPTDVNNASIFYEMDTKKVYLFDEESGTWTGDAAAGGGSDDMVTVYGEVDVTRDDILSMRMIFPNVVEIDSFAFMMLSCLRNADFPVATEIGSYTFEYFTDLQTLILRYADGVVALGRNAFTESGIESGTGYVYVPKSLVEQYKVANEWSAYASQIRAIEDYPDVCGVSE